MIKTTPHLESQLPYGYRFEAIDVCLVDYNGNLDLFIELHDTHEVHSIEIGKDNPHRDRIIWEIASHIEGNFGPPYKATLVHSSENGQISIYTPKGGQWWNVERWSELSNYLMGLRSLLDLLGSKS